jgi:hypothetical protein
MVGVHWLGVCVGRLRVLLLRMPQCHICPTKTEMKSGAVSRQLWDASTAGHLHQIHTLTFIK